jgi:hypothetical protein
MSTSVCAISNAIYRRRGSTAKWYDVAERVLVLLMTSSTPVEWYIARVSCATTITRRRFARCTELLYPFLVDSVRAGN